jgi:hypothetical protein
MLMQGVLPANAARLAGWAGHLAASNPVPWRAIFLNNREVLRAMLDVSTVKLWSDRTGNVSAADPRHHVS